MLQKNSPIAHESGPSDANSGRAMQLFRRGLFSDPRKSVALILFCYLVLGFTVLGFNRSPVQVALTTLLACNLEVILMKLTRRPIRFPWSALITSFGLSLLLNYSHSYMLLFAPVIFAIGSKYVFTLNGRHVLTPHKLPLCSLCSSPTT